MEDGDKYKNYIKNNLQELINEGKLEEANSLILEYEKNVIDDIDVVSMKSVILIMGNELEEAQKILQQTIDLDRSNSDVFFNMAYIHEIKGEYIEAYRYYTLAKNISDDEEFILNVDNIIINLVENYDLNLEGSNRNIRTSIVILTYNKLDYTKLCIESIRKYTPIDTYEIIVVDNNSTDDTRNWLKDQEDLKVILNDENLGFPGGCNVGIKEAEINSDILLLNNDTIVTPRWLENLNNCLYSDEAIGAVGAVSNSCANYQTIQAEYNSIDQMLSFAEKYNISDPSRWEQKVRLIGFCMLIKRNIIDEVGLLDERFFPGNFEDDDLGYRIQARGYKLILCNDTFVHHFGSTSFKDNQEKFTTLLKENSLKFINKWGFNSEDNSHCYLDIISKLNPSKTQFNILHIGCGTGSTLLKIKYIFNKANLFGITEDEKEYEFSKKIADVRMGNIDEKIDYPDNYFDYIILTDSLEYSNNPSYVLGNISRILKDTGKIFITLKNSNFYEEIIKTLMGSLDTNKKNLYKYYNYNEIINLFKDDSFENVIIEPQGSNINPEGTKIIDYLSKLTGEKMKNEYSAKDYLISCEKKSNSKKEIEYILRRIENSIDTNNNLRLLSEYFHYNEWYEDVNDIISKTIINKEEVFNKIATYIYEIGRPLDALKLLEKAYNLNSKYKDTVYNLSYIIYKMGDKRTALAYLDSVFIDDNDFEKLRLEIMGDSDE